MSFTWVSGGEDEGAAAPAQDAGGPARGRGPLSVCVPVRVPGPLRPDGTSAGQATVGSGSPGSAEAGRGSRDPPWSPACTLISGSSSGTVTRPSAPSQAPSPFECRHSTPRKPLRP